MFVDTTRILLVEDSPADARLVELSLTTLSIARFTVTHAGRLDEALRLLAAQAFDAVLLDLSLPDSFGLDTVAQVRAAAPELAIIVLSGLSDEEIAVHAVKMGAQDYLVKGLENAPLIARAVRYAMERQRAEEALRAAREELEQRVRERTADLEQANRRLQQEIAERKQAEDRERQRMAELAHVGRLSAIGEMTTQIAHEINQPLTAIASYADACLRLLQAEGGGSPALSEALRDIGGQAERAGEVIRQLRSLVRKDTSHRSTVDVNGLVREVVHLIGAEARWYEVAIQLELVEHLPPVLADKILIEQVILNLTRNGIEAMAGDPRGARRLIIRTGAGEGSVEVAVCDNGPGLPPELMARVFESFFTTKANGMGMGLSISRSIIKSHGGRLRARPNGERGAVFTFTLPTNPERSDAHAH